jgi:transposase
METLTDPRFLRGIEIARRGGARQLRRALWSVNSATHTGSYLVDLAADVPACTCPDYEEHGGPVEFKCKHAYAALIQAKQIEVPSGMTSDGKRQTYKQAWPAYEAAQLHERAHFETLLRDLCGGIVNPVHKRGRPRKPLADVVFAAVQRAYSGLSSRRAHSDVCSAADAGLIDGALSPKTLIRYLDDPKLTDVLRTLIRESAAPLADVESRFAVDSTGFSTCNYERWFDHKWGRERSKRQWIKAHVIVGVHTNVVTDVLVTDNVGDGSGDAPQLPELVSNTAERFSMREVSADKAYMSRQNFDAIEKVGAVPYIPFRSGTTGEGPATWRRMWALFMYRGEEFGKHYHARSNVETTFSMIKRKFGASLRAKSFVAQRNEVLCKVLAHNLVVLVGAMYELGITAEFWGAPAQGGCDVH